MKRNWYRFRIKYHKMAENGKMKKASEDFIADAESFTETEKRATKLATDELGARDFDVCAIVRETITEIVNDKTDDDGHWYKAVVNLFEDNVETEESKSIAQTLYIFAVDTEKAVKILREHMKGSIADWSIKSITMTRVLEILRYSK